MATYTIGQAAEMTGLSVSTLRYYEKEGLLPFVERTGGGRRVFSDEDFRCPLSEGLQMYSALVENGVEAKMCIFKGENHELSRSGRPKQRIRRLEEITDWMEKHLK